MAIQKRHSYAAARAALPAGQWSKLLLKASSGMLLAALFGWLLANRLTDIPLETTQTALLAVTAPQWIMALFATLISFWAVGHYDGAIHRHLATGISPRAARRAGATAIAVSQTLGFGVITGALLRWRMLPGLSLWQATKLTSLVAVFFLCGWAIVTALVLVVVLESPFKPIAAGALVLLLPLICVGAVTPRLRDKNWPNLFTITRLVGLAAIDTLAAALSLWLLCAPDLSLPFMTLLPAFLIAFGAGLVSGTPGGVGAFEITLLALLPTVPEAPLLAAILAWRVVYFAAPAIIGAGVAIRGPLQSHDATAPAPHAALVEAAFRAETGLLAQGHLCVTSAGHGQAWLTGRTPHCLIGMLDPLVPHRSPDSNHACSKRAIAALIDHAKSEQRLAVIYKCTARTAIAARQLGLLLRPIAREAWLDPRGFALNTPSRAALRRKLRHADRAGITIQTEPLDWQHLTQIAQDWAAAHGSEHGFSMGRFDRTYLSGQRIYVANLAGKPVAFASFHIGKTEWTLDLMRQTSCVPDGSMHALILRAISDAAAIGLSRLSLAAVPLAALSAPPKGRIAEFFHLLLGGNQTGLAQFKSAFVPNWQTLYIAAVHKPALALAGLEIAREVHFPRPLKPSPHYLHEQYEIASGLQPWHREGEHDPVTHA